MDSATIQRLKSELNKIINSKGLNHPDVIKKSQELDRALNDFNK